MLAGGSVGEKQEGERGSRSGGRPFSEGQRGVAREGESRAVEGPAVPASGGSPPGKAWAAVGPAKQGGDRETVTRAGRGRGRERGLLRGRSGAQRRSCAQTGQSPRSGPAGAGGRQG